MFEKEKLGCWQPFILLLSQVVKKEKSFRSYLLLTSLNFQIFPARTLVILHKLSF